MTGKRAALIVASGRFIDNDLRQLVAPAQDAEALSRVLADPTIGRFEVQTVLNEPSYTVKQAIETFFADRKRGDLLLLYLSCHGIKHEDGQLYYATTDTRRKLLRSTAISANFVNNIMRRSLSRQQVLLLDCCYSGAFARGMVTKADKVIGTGEHFKEGRGRLILTASDAMQYAFEGAEIKGEGVRSIFTHTLVRGLETGEADIDMDGYVSFDDLYFYVHDRVTDQKPEQRPKKWAIDAEGKIIIACNPKPVMKPLFPELRQAIESPIAQVRKGAVETLVSLFRGSDKGLVLAAHEALKRLIEDDSRIVSTAAKRSLSSQSEEQTWPEKTQVDSEQPPMLSGVEVSELINDLGVDQMPPNSSSFHILHISDLHIKEHEDFDQSVVLEPLINRVKKDHQDGIQPEIVVVTGDIAYQGTKSEYDLAKAFFDDLLTALGLERDRIFIVPGNHDVNRKKYRPSDRPVYENMRALNDEFENENFRADLLKGMTDYFDAIESHYPHLKSLNDRLVPFVHIFQTAFGKRIGLVGLNSAWMCRKSPDEREIAIGEYQVKTALKELDNEDKTDSNIFLFHHPLSWLQPLDRRICRGYFESSVLLCGHLHDFEGGFINDLNGNYFQFQSGGAYLGSESDWPSRFQYICIDWQENKIQLEFRKYVKERRLWSVDSETGDDGQKCFQWQVANRQESLSESATAPEIPKVYLNWLIENYGYMEADKLHGKDQAIPLHLPKLFIPLYAIEPEKPDSKADDIEARQAPVDIEKLIAKNDYLLIEGQAGSGKTTLLKHFTYCLALQYSKPQPLDGLHNVLPVLIRLKYLEDLLEDKAMQSSRDLAAEDILAWYISNKIGGIIDTDTLNKFIRDKKAIFLLDGLDEVQRPVRDIIVNAFANLRIKNPDIKVVLSGRIHGMEGAVVNKFGAKYVKILPLNPDQVSMFIKKWYDFLDPEISGLNGKNANAMIGEIKAHPAIDKLIDNPLMLTAICILYHDGRELPGQRAELYKKFIDNLLYRKFSDPENVYEFLKTLAFQMHAERKRAVDRTVPTRILKDIYEINTNEFRKNLKKKRLDQIFNDIKLKSGLLKFENGQYSFWHLTFQEFLTADYFVDNYSDHIKAIEEYWTDDWYKEVIELYIGYLSIEYRRTANDIISSAINVSDQPPYKRWRLAAQSMIAIHKNRRQTHVIDACRKQMLEIIASMSEPAIRVDAGESLGWLGELRELKAFIRIEIDEYELEEIGKVNFDPFEIGEYPVTNAWFEEFITADGYQNKHFWSPEGLKWLDYKGTERPLFWDQRGWTCPNSPAVGVSWYEAYAFTQWLTHARSDDYEYRLLTEVEWQAAAAGKSKRKYPWGKVWQPDHCNTMDSGIRRTSPVGIFENGKTPEGLSDMSGNVWEWTCSEYHSGETRSDFNFDKKSQQLLDEEKRQVPVLRGGSWSDDSLIRGIATCADRFSIWPTARQDNVGFRCVRTRA